MLRYFSIMLTRIKRCLLGCAFTLYKPKGDQSLFASIAKVKATTQLDKLGELNTQWCLGPKISTITPQFLFILTPWLATRPLNLKCIH
jgi:hypothetical protein